MSKTIKYNMFAGEGEQKTVHRVEMDWSEANEEIAKKESFGGEYVIEDTEDDFFEEPTILDKIEAQVTYTAIITETLLEG